MTATLHLDLPAPQHEALNRAITTLLACVETCNACAGACLREPDVAKMRHCIATDLDCAAICETTVGMLARFDGTLRQDQKALLETCIVACRTCGDECASHAAHHDHCKVCADACRQCEDACRDLLAALAAR
jgi:hypothetical protein